MVQAVDSSSAPDSEYFLATNRLPGDKVVGDRAAYGLSARQALSPTYLGKRGDLIFRKIDDGSHDDGCRCMTTRR